MPWPTRRSFVRDLVSSAGEACRKRLAGPLRTPTAHPWRGRVWLLADLGMLTLAALESLPFALRPGHVANDPQYKLWTRLVTLDGVQAAYSGTWPETYAIYPPVPLYFFKAVGHAYQAFVDPSFELQRALASQGLTTALKAVGIGFHLLTGLSVFLLVSRTAGERAGLFASAAYALNPAAIYNIASWGQPDSIHGLFATLATGLLVLGRPGWSGASLGLALMSKPQAWAVLPVLGIAALHAGASGRIRFGLACAGAALLPLAPFIATGHLAEFLSLPARISDVMPVVTANAHNLWWIITQGQDSPFVRVDAVVLGPLTYRQAAVPLVLGAAVFSVWRLGPARPAWRIALLASYLAFAWFMLTTQAHDTHAFFVLPLLALVLDRQASLRVAFAVLTLTVLTNVYLHDPLRWNDIEATIGEHGRWTASQINAWVNLALFAYWTWWVARLTRRQPTTV